MIRNKLLILVFAVALLLPFVARAQNRQLTQENGAAPQRRVALVIGNADYAVARKLSNPANDANDMAETLRDVGFEVVAGTNLNLKQMTDKVREFGDKLKAAGGVGLFYYAGHGIQVNNRNYLIPIEADITREDEIDFSALNFDQVLRKMATANNGLNIVVLDACRNNPFARSWNRDAGERGGLAQISAPTGTFIAYATSPDQTASDGTGRNGLYTAELLKFIKQPNLKIEETFKEVRKAVNKASGGKQIPWDSSSLSGDFYFNDSSLAKNSSTKKRSEKSPTQTNKTGETEKEKLEKSNDLRIVRYRDIEVSPRNYRVGIVLENFKKTAASVKVFINDAEVTDYIALQSDTGVTLEAHVEELNLRVGRNTAYVVVNGVKSEVYVFTRANFTLRER